MKKALFTFATISIYLMSGTVGEAGVFTDATRMCEQNFIPQDDLKSSEKVNIQDIEFDHVGKRMVFDSSGRIVVVDLNTVDGELLGAQVLDTGAVKNVPGLPFGDGGGNGNGPEWAYSLTRGFEIYYTKVDSDGRGCMASLYQGSDKRNSWQKRVIPESTNEGIPIATFNLTDEFPTIAYIGGTNTQPLALLRTDRDVNFVEQVVPNVDLSSVTGGSPARFVPGRRETIAGRVVTDALGNRKSQIVRTSFDSGAEDVIGEYSNGESIKSVSVIQLGPDTYVFYAIIDHHHIDIYLSLGWRQNALVNQIRPPVGTNYLNKYVLDEENFVGRDGLPYISIVMDGDAQNMTGSSEIWVAYAFATRPCHYRKVSTTSKFALVSDPEPLAVELGTFIYYSEKINGVWRLHKAATGL